MSTIEVDRCNGCGKETNDYYNEVGWIKIDDKGFHVSGGRQNDGVANTVRYIEFLQVINNKSLDFCCVECLLNYLFFSDGYFNRNITYEEFKRIQKKNDKIGSKLYEEIMILFDDIWKMANPTRRSDMDRKEAIDKAGDLYRMWMKQGINKEDAEVISCLRQTAKKVEEVVENAKKELKDLTSNYHPGYMQSEINARKAQLRVVISLLTEEATNEGTGKGD